MSDVAKCTGCGAKNRLAPHPDKIPICGRCSEPLPCLVSADDTTLDAELASPLPVLLDLWAPWCQPCLIMAPALEDLARDFAGRLKVVKVDVQKNLATHSRFKVMGLPTLLLVDGGKEVERMVGARSKAELARILEAHTSSAKAC